jgi:hypothetical protein
MASEWRGYIYLGLEEDGYHFVIPHHTAPGIPTRGGHTVVPMDFELLQGSVHPGMFDAVRYWMLREGWRGQSAEEIEALYAKWLPRRDAILGKEEHLGKSRTDWERFYLALADEKAARDYAAGRVSASFGLDGRELLKAMMATGGKGVAG